MAKEASTMPGRWATLATCCSARSASALANSDGEANTRPGTRMPRSGANSQVTSPVRLKSIGAL